jgi:hypothetical protein
MHCAKQSCNREVNILKLIFFTPEVFARKRVSEIKMRNHISERIGRRIERETFFFFFFRLVGGRGHDT